MKVYTKTGDKGSTSLIGGTRVAKNDLRLESYGAVDELNSFLGLLRSKIADETLKNEILSVQNKLFVVGAQLACEISEGESFPDYAHVKEEWITELETSIDHMDAELPKMTRFIVYGEDEISAVCHICRAVCRRSERLIVSVSQTYIVENELLQYVNRLSDFLFVLARYLSPSEKKAEFFRHK
ncbi:MAG: cob(I)yrinic acid a,c-diamide adenosyltransferase [Bacteroidales bacterium]|nr:cob(I)yrinic acid a,c-diamide adenosyltransferase [Bacteroidales bacterium]